MKWNIVTDSSCDLSDRENKLSGGIPFFKVPFSITTENKHFTDDMDLNVAEMLDAMERSQDICRTACPSPALYADLFQQAENTIAITISSALSGSYQSALIARDLVLEEYPEKNIFVLDSRSAGSALAMFAAKAEELILHGLDFSEVVQALSLYAHHRHTVFALSSFNNLVKNGRISKLVGYVAGKLGMWGIGAANPEGHIHFKGTVRGKFQAVEQIIQDMKEHCFECGTVVISHCQNAELARELETRIRQIWRSAQVKILSTGGLCSFYAERKGLIVAY